MVSRLFISSDFKKYVKKLKKEHKDVLLSKIVDIIHKLEKLEVISGQHKNHKLGGAEGVQDIHIGDDLILLYRYAGDVLCIDLQVLNLVNHSDLYDKSAPKFVKKQLFKQVDMPYNINEEKKKKSEFGSFCTLNPDAGDVNKSIEFFNNAVSSDIGSEVQSLGEGNEMNWTDVYSQFEEIVDENFPFVDDINEKVDALYAEHKGDPAWDEAYERWSTTIGTDQNDEEEDADDEIQEG